MNSAWKRAFLWVQTSLVFFQWLLEWVFNFHYFNSQCGKLSDSISLGIRCRVLKMRCSCRGIMTCNFILILLHPDFYYCHVRKVKRIVSWVGNSKHFYPKSKKIINWMGRLAAFNLQHPNPNNVFSSETFRHVALQIQCYY